jgi:hypothetical protein
VLRLRVVLRAGFFAPVAAAFARDAGAFRAAVEGDERAADDFARAGLAFLAAVLREPVERLAVERFVVDLRAELARVERADDDELLPPLALEPSSAVHLPDITRCAASATASAISEPSLVALAIMLLAAWLAVSAASRPASRIARRAFGLALIAAAAAAKPAASISLLIAALASLSTVSLLEELLPEELLLEDFAIACSPSVGQKTLQARNGSRMNAEVRGAPNM